MRTRTERSAGGVAFRASDDDPLSFDVAIIRTHEGRWQLPKGWIEDGEPAERAAIREVREEAGIDAEMVAHLGTVEYWYVSTYEAEPARIHKFVEFYLLRYTGGSTEDHDDEVTEARWSPLNDAITMLSHKDERGMVERARDLLADAVIDS